jgi:hypothetical protein
LKKTTKVAEGKMRYFLSVTELANPKKNYARVIFSEKSGKKYVLPSATFFFFLKG